MYKLKVKGKKEKKLIGNKFRYYVDFVILACCFIIAINIHPLNNSTNKAPNSSRDNKLIYIFHDYEGNEYVMNDSTHGVSSSWDYLFDDEVPSDLRGDEDEDEDDYENKKNEGSVSIGDLFEDFENNQMGDDENNQIDNYESIKDNQISIDDIMSDLGIEDAEDTDDEIALTEDTNNNSLDIDVQDYQSEENIYDDAIYIVNEETGTDNNSLIIEKLDNNGDKKLGGISGNNYEIIDNNNEKDMSNDTNYENNDLLIAKSFSFIEEGRVLPTLVSWNDLFFDNLDQTVSYTNNHTQNEINNKYDEKSGITIIEDYDDCITPWGYKVEHGDSVLAYQQMDNAPGICNIERRFCWKGKLSGTYTQQGCTIKNNSNNRQQGGSTSSSTKGGGDGKTTNQGGNSQSSSSYSKGNFKGKTKQNEDGSVSVKSSEIGGSFVFSGVNDTYTDFTGNGNNIRPEDSGIELLYKEYPNCTAPRGEKVKHGQFVQAFKHKYGFSDIPCEAQIRLCSVGDLMGSYTESSCKTWDTSFVDWVYGSPTRQTYSEEKLELIKKQIKSDDRLYNKNRKKVGELSNVDDYSDLLYILDDNY